MSLVTQVWKPFHCPLVEKRINTWLIIISIITIINMYIELAYKNFIFKGVYLLLLLICVMSVRGNKCLRVNEEVKEQLLSPPLSLLCRF